MDHLSVQLLHSRVQQGVEGAHGGRLQSQGRGTEVDPDGRHQVRALELTQLEEVSSGVGQTFSQTELVQKEACG